MDSWILTFNRPLALNRQINALKGWTNVHIFSNHPDIGLDAENTKDYNSGKIKIIFNTLSDPEATSYCARSWNNIFLKCFKTEEEVICIQDDTQITNPDKFRDLILTNKDQYDLIWGPAGDQFFYIKKDVIRKIGFFDERFSTGCFCGDADFLKRAWRGLDKDRISVSESHDWGFQHNNIGLGNFIPTHIGSKSIDPDYVNQYHEIEKIDPQSVCLNYAQDFWRKKWGHSLNGTGSITQHTNPPNFPELYLYPWFVKKYLGISELPNWCIQEKI